MSRCPTLIRWRILLSVITVLILPTAAVTQSGPPQASLESITADELIGLIKFFSSDWFEGRATGQPGYDLGTDFIASQLAAGGIKPAGPDGSYFQAFDLVRRQMADDMSLVLVREGVEPISYSVGTDFAPQSSSAGWNVASALIFAGFGISSSDPAWDDYEGLDIEGKIVIVVNQYPGLGTDNVPVGEEWTGRRATSNKMRIAREKGAVALIIVPHPRFVEETRIRLPRSSSRLLLPGRSRRGGSLFAFPMITAGTKVSDDIFGPGRLAAVVEQMESDNRPAGISFQNLRARAHVTVNEEEVPTRNVLAIIEGTDLKDEYVLLGAHADHNGMRGNQVMNGADDDGSGSMMLLELAEAFAISPVRPRRSIVFGWWSGEEIGLYGSWYYANNPPFPLEKTAGLVQLDMIGRNEEIKESSRLELPLQRPEDNANSIHMIGYSYSSDMQNFTEKANEGIGMRLRYEYDTGPQGLIRRSDHWHFLQLGVPVAFFFTGFHPDYHQPTDTWNKINYPKMEKIGKMLFRMVWDLANTDNPPKLNPDRDPGSR